MEQAQNLENQNNQNNQNKKANKKLLLLIAALALIFVLAGGVFLFKDKIFPSESEIKNKESQQEEFIKEEKKDINENDAERKFDLSVIKSTLEFYYNDNSQYPTSNELTKLSDNAFLYESFLPYLVISYSAYYEGDESIFKDPKDPEFYYGYKSDGSYYELTARLENLEDEECELLNDDLCIYKIDSKGNVSKKINKSY